MRPDETDRFDELIEEVQVDCESRVNADIWLYLAISWLYERRLEIANIFDVVEMVYSDFDYPEELGGFIPYMPPPANGQPGEAGMIARMKEYLDKMTSRFLVSRHRD